MKKKDKEINDIKDNEIQDNDLEFLSINKIAKSEELKKKPLNKKVRIAIMVISAIVFIVSAYQLYSIFIGYKQANDLYDNIDGVTVDIPSESELSDGVDYTDPPEGLLPYVKVNVDFAKLKKTNSDFVGWIQFEHVNISYPIVQTTDNEYYLKKTFQKTDNSAGCIFMEHGNNPGFNDMNTFIYGHNMKNASMFGWLGRYKNESFYTQRDCFWIYTEKADYRYQIFAAYEVKEDSEMYTWWSGSCDAYGEYLKKAKKASKYDTGVSVNQNDKIVTLSTCTSTGKSYRFIVQGKLILTNPR